MVYGQIILTCHCTLLESPLTRTVTLVMVPWRKSYGPRANNSCRAWHFTIFLEDPEDWDIDPGLWVGYYYLVYQEEVTQSGKHHYQGYVVWNYPKTYSQVRAVRQCFWQEQYSTFARSVSYCTKFETRVDGPWYGKNTKVHGLNPSDFKVARANQTAMFFLNNK